MACPLSFAPAPVWPASTTGASNSTRPAPGDESVSKPAGQLGIVRGNPDGKEARRPATGLRRRSAGYGRTARVRRSLAEGRALAAPAPAASFACLPPLIGRPRHEPGDTAPPIGDLLPECHGSVATEIRRGATAGHRRPGGLSGPSKRHVARTPEYLLSGKLCDHRPRRRVRHGTGPGADATERHPQREGALDLTISGFTRFLVAGGELRQKGRGGFFLVPDIPPTSGSFDFRNETEVHIFPQPARRYGPRVRCHHRI